MSKPRGNVKVWPLSSTVLTFGAVGLSSAKTPATEESKTVTSISRFIAAPSGHWGFAMPAQRHYHTRPGNAGKHGPGQNPSPGPSPKRGGEKYISFSPPR